MTNVMNHERNFSIEFDSLAGFEATPHCRSVAITDPTKFYYTRISECEVGLTVFIYKNNQKFLTD